MTKHSHRRLCLRACLRPKERKHCCVPLRWRRLARSHPSFKSPTCARNSVTGTRPSGSPRRIAALLAGVNAPPGRSPRKLPASHSRHAVRRPALLHHVRPSEWDRYERRKPAEMRCVPSVHSLPWMQRGDRKASRSPTILAMQSAPRRPCRPCKKRVTVRASTTASLYRHPTWFLTQPWMLLLEPQPTEGEPGKPNDGKTSG